MDNLQVLTPLEKQFFDAAKTNNFKQLSICLQKGVNANIHFDRDITALHLAAGRGDLQLAIKLATYKDLDYDCQTLQGYTPLILSCIIRSRKFMRFLLKNGADANKTDYMRKGPLHYACLTNALELAILLMNNGANVNAMDCFERTPLAIALLDSRSTVLAKYLLTHGALIDYESNNNFQLFLECVLSCYKEEHIEGVELLLQHGADIHMCDPTGGRTCLHLVALTGYVPLARKLLELGANCNALNVSKKKPMDVARDHGNYEVYALLKYITKFNDETIGSDDTIFKMFNRLGFK